MSYCEECRTPLADDERHQFAGYGFYVVYCARCCPLKLDGWECDKDHPLRVQAGVFENVWLSGECGPASRCVNCDAIVRSAQEMMTHQCKK